MIDLGNGYSYNDVTGQFMTSYGEGGMQMPVAGDTVINGNETQQPKSLSQLLSESQASTARKGALDSRIAELQSKGFPYPLAIRYLNSVGAEDAGVFKNSYGQLMGSEAPSDPQSFESWFNEATRKAIELSPKDSGLGWFGDMVPMIIAGMATAGMGGFLPGTESIFGGAGGLGLGGATGAAEGGAALGGLGETGFIDAIGSGVGAGGSITGSLGATGAGSGAMDWADFGSSFLDGTAGANDALSQILNMGNVPAAATAWNGLGTQSFIDSIVSKLSNLGLSPTQAASAVKSLVGSGSTGSGSNSLLGTALGGLLGSMNGSQQAGTTTVTQEPWAGQQPYLLDAFKKAQTAAGGSPLQTQANTNYSSVLSGPTTNPMLGMDNPYLTSAINNANADVTRAFMPAVNQANRASGSFGNSGVADTYGKSMADAYSRKATTMRMQDYTNQQNLQQQAVNNTLGFTSNANNFAAQPSQNYAQTVQGNYGGQTTTPYYNNPINGIMGGAMVGNSIGSNLGF